MKQYDSSIQATARDLARLLERARAAHPEIPWREPWRPNSDTPQYEPAFTQRGEANLRAIIERRRAGQSYHDIAQAIGLSEMSINTLVYRARKRGLWPDDLAPGRVVKASEP